MKRLATDLLLVAAGALAMLPLAVAAWLVIIDAAEAEALLRTRAHSAQVGQTMRHIAATAPRAKECELHEHGATCDIVDRRGVAQRVHVPK